MFVDRPHQRARQAHHRLRGAVVAWRRSSQEPRFELTESGREAIHPEVASPGQWSRTLAAEYVAAVDKATVGGWSANPKKVTSGTLGKPFKPRSKAGYLAALRGFFRDLQEWGLIETRFDPRRAFSVPQPIQQLVGPDPRIIDETFWAKLLQAGLSLTDEDVRSSGHNYPAAMVRALAVVWLFCGIRRDEIRRLRVGCVRRQTRDARVPASDELLPKGTVVFLDVPPNKTTAAYTKPVDPVLADVGRSVGVRAAQPARHAGRQSRCNGALPVRQSWPHDRHGIPQCHAHPTAVPEGRHPRG
jgi:integrase